MVRKILDREKIEINWVKDMQGTDICKNIINPILKEIRCMLQKYNRRTPDKNMTLNEIERLQNYQELALRLITDINTQKLQRKILNYIAPHFQLQHQNEKNMLDFDE
jgi:chemotaxis regulatin CheY-phosphate phosphatase CheZ